MIRLISAEILTAFLVTALLMKQVRMTGMILLIQQSLLRSLKQMIRMAIFLMEKIMLSERLAL